MSPAPAVNISIRQMREAAGITQAELARRLGVAAPLVARWESPSGRPKVDTLQRIADALGLNLSVTFLSAIPKTD
jgi:transcriptional regulator with XRE-family HTH domain